jgi:alkanesulfonate monooxygenase SsuD/methylene tetrahydromethanopterin reductase-like flavin-dependent oxidoreductase (luciferase family)
VTPSFGLLAPMVARGRSAGELLRELAVEAREAERAGLDVIWVPEHHQGPSGSLTDPIAVAAWLLASTERIRVGTGVLVAPLHHPVRLAEQAAILHDTSGGRLVLGVGAGYQHADFAIFGRDRERRRDDLEACVAVLRGAWRGDPVAGAGIAVAPRPPGPPPELWLGAWSRWGIRAAARLADGWIADPIRTEDEIAEMAVRYRAAAAAAGVPARVHLSRDLWVAGDGAAARAGYAAHVEPIYRYYLREGALGEAHGLGPEDLVLGRRLDERVICGSPGEVVTRVRVLMERTGAEGCSFALRHPSGPGHEDVLDAIRLLGSDVLPALRGPASAR